MSYLWYLSFFTYSGVNSLSYSVSLRSEFCNVMSATISTRKRCSVRHLPQLFVGELMSNL